MSEYLQYTDQTETWRARKTDRHITDDFIRDYHVIYDSDDHVPDPDATAQFAIAASKGDYDLLYCDEDVIHDHERMDPYFKPGYSPESEMSLGYISGMVAIKKGMQFNPLYSFRRDRVCHIEKVLYHRKKKRQIRPTAADDPFIDKIEGKISIIILSRDHPDMFERCVRSVKASMSGDEVEIILIENKSQEGARRRYQDLSQQYGVTMYCCDDEFNYSSLNTLGVEKSTGDVLIFMNDDIEIPEQEKGVLERMAKLAVREDCGAVGIKLLYPGGEKIQHCGIFLLHSGPSHKLQGYKDEQYYYGFSDHDVNVIAVTGACLAVKKSRFEEVGGFDERLAVAYNDVDLCMKLFEAGYNNVCMNSHHLIHHEGATRSDDRTDRDSYERLKEERVYFISKHGEIVDRGDPYLNKNISRYTLDFALNMTEEWETFGRSSVWENKGRVKTRKHVHASFDSFSYCLSDAYGNEDFYEARGWIFDEGLRKLKPCVVIEGGGKQLIADTAVMRRTDVRDAFPNFKKSERSGFIARIPKREFQESGVSGDITVYPAFMDRKKRIFKGDIECQKTAKI